MSFPPSLALQPGSAPSLVMISSPSSSQQHISTSTFFNDRVRTCTDTLRSYATPAEPADVWARERWRKAHTHLLILHALRHIHDDSARYPSCDLKDALGYASLVVKMVGQYVEMEGGYYWVELAREGETLVEEGGEGEEEGENPFAPSLSLTASMTSLLTTLLPPLQAFLVQSQLYHDTFNPATLEAHLVKLAGPLAESFAGEVGRLGPEAMRRVFRGDEAALREFREDVENELRRKVDKFQYYPVLLSNIDPSLIDILLPLTWVQKEIVVPWVLTAKNRGFWEYARFPENLGYEPFREHTHRLGR